MSLIYQALQQTGEQARSGPSTERLSLPAPQLTPKTAGERSRPLVLVGAAMAGAGVMGGFFISHWGNAPALPDLAMKPVSAQQVLVKPSGTASIFDPQPSLTPPLPAAVQSSLPRMEAPLPTASPRLVLTTAPPGAVPPPPKGKPAVQPVATAVAVVPASAAAPAEALSAAPAPVSAASSEPPQSATPVSIPARALSDPPADSAPSSSSPAPLTPASSSTSDDLSDRFERMNLALENKDAAAAQRHLQAIQNQLPATSVARLRAEAWFAYQSGDLGSAQRTYRRLLDRLPGDEQAALALASIEKTNARPDQAREVLSRSLRANPGSVPLRSAMDRLATNGSPQ